MLLTVREINLIFCSLETVFFFQYLCHNMKNYFIMNVQSESHKVINCFKLKSCRFAFSINLN